MFIHAGPCGVAEWLGVWPLELACLGSNLSSSLEPPHLYNGHNANSACLIG